MHSAKKGALETSSRILQNGFAHLLQSSTLLACNFIKYELLHKSIQDFSLDHQNAIFPQQLFMANSCQRVPNPLIL